MKPIQYLIKGGSLSTTLSMIINKEENAEEICEMYEEKEQLDTKLS